MNEIDVTKMIALRFWWSWTWRNNLFGFLAGFVLGVTSGIVTPMIGMPAETASFIQTLLGIAIALIISVVIIKKLLRQKYSKFRISVIDKISSQEVKEVSYGMAIHFNWSFFWKMILAMLGLTIPSAIIIGIVASILSATTGMSLNSPTSIIFFIICYILILIASIFIQIFILKSLLKAEYSDYRITVLENDQIIY